jgi:hypothetical protein
MDYRYKKHYTLAEARALLPEVRRWLERLVQGRADLQDCEKRLQKVIAPGCDSGGKTVNAWVKALANIQQFLLQFYQREIQIKDLDRGLIDFPAIIDGKEVFLCWEKAEADIEFWHGLDDGYAGRERLEE